MSVTPTWYPDPARPSRVPRIAVAVLAVVLLAALAGGYLALRGGGDSDGPAAVPSSTTSAPTAPTTPTTSPAADPLDDPMSPESIDLRYDRLAEHVTAGAQRCHRAKKGPGQAERLRCATAAGRLELVTYRSTAALEARRATAVTDAPGGVLDTSPTGTTMAFHADAAKGRGSAGQTYLYWDADRSRQSAVYLADPGTGLVDLAAAYDATTPARPYPTGPGRQVTRFARRWVGSGTCVRTETVNAGALEESYCDVSGPVEVFVGRFGTPEQLLAYRKIVVASAIADKRKARDWTARSGGDPVGALYEYTTDDGTVARYWDDPSCSCYAEAFLADGSYTRLSRWWDGKS